MIIHPQIEQGTEEWLSIRRGRITASEVGAFAVAEKSLALTIPEIKDKLDVLGIDYKKTAKKDELAELLPNAKRYEVHTQATINARSALYAKKIAERSGTEMYEQYVERITGYKRGTLAMQRGSELESLARELYELVTGYTMTEVGFCEHDNGLCGASPDGVRLDASGENILSAVEIKCHLPETHVKFLLDPDSFENEHKHQLHWQLAIMGCEFVDLFGFCPSVPYIKRRVFKNEYTARMVNAIDELSEEYRSAIDAYCEIYDEQVEYRAALREGAA